MRCHVTWHCLFSSAQTASLLWGHLPWCVEAQMMWGSPRVATTMLFYMQCHPGQKPKHLGGLRETLQAISYITIHHEVALSPRPISAGLPHRAAVLYIKPNHEAVLSPSLDPYLQVFHIGLQVLPAPLCSLLKDSLEARCRLTRQLLHIEELDQLLGARVFLHCHSPQHTQVWRHALCNNQSPSHFSQ